MQDRAPLVTIITGCYDVGLFSAEQPKMVPARQSLRGFYAVFD